MKPKFRLHSFLLSSTILSASFAQAASPYTWAPTAAGTYAWNNVSAADNWAQGTANFPNAAGDVANLSIDIAGAQTVQLNQAITVGSLTFGDSTGNSGIVTIAPNSGSLIFDNSGSGATLTHSASTTVDVISSGMTLNDNLAIVNNGATAGKNNALNLSGKFTGTGRITVNSGNGYVYLSNTTNDYSGGFTLNTGATVMTGGNSAAFGTGTVTINGGQITTAFGGAASQPITTSNLNVWNGNWTLISDTSAKTITFQGGVTLGATIAATINQTLALPGVVSGSGFGLTQSGTGTLSLQNTANTYSGPTKVNQGTISFNSIANVSGGNSSLGAPTTTADGTINIGSGTTTAGTLSYAGSANCTSDRVLNLAATTTGGATLDQSGTGKLTFTNDLLNATTSGNKTFTLSGSTLGVGEISGKIVNGSGGTLLVTKTGTGTWLLSGANTYTGATAVNGGTLKVATGTGTRNTSAVTIANTAGCVFGAQVAATDGQWASTSNLTVSGANSEIDIDYLTTAPSTTTDPISVVNLTVSGAGTLKVLGEVSQFAVSSTYPLVNFTGTGPAAADPYTGLTLSLPTGITGNLTTTANHVNLVITGNTTKSWNTGNGTWDSGTPWATYSGAASYSDGDAVYLSDAASSSGDPTITVSGASVSPGSIVMNSSSHSYTVSGNPVVGGGSLTVNSTGGKSLTLTGANNYSGGTTLSAGTLNIQNATALGSGSLTISGGALDTSVSGITMTANNPQSWNGNFTFTGTGNLNLGTGAVTLGGNRQVTVSANTLTVGGVISGATFNLNKLGSGTLALTAANTYSGTTTVSGGTLMLGDGTGDTGSFASTTSVTVNGTLAINRTGSIAQGASSPLGNSLVISGTGSILMMGGGGTGSLSMSLANTFTGGVTLQAGTLNINSNGVVNTSGPLGNNGTFTINGGTIDNTSGAARVVANVNPIVVGGNFNFSTGSGTALNNLTLPGSVNLGGVTRTITTNGVGVLTLSGVTSNGGLTKEGTGTLTLSNFNAPTIGAINVNNGTLIFNTANTKNLGTGTAISVASGGQLRFNVGGSTDGVIARAISVAGNTSTGALAVGGNSTIELSGAITLTADTGITPDGGTTLKITNTVTGTNTSLSHNGNGFANISGALSLGTGAVIKGTGNSTLTLSNGSNSYSGGLFQNGTGGITISALGAQGSGDITFATGGSASVTFSNVSGIVANNIVSTSGTGGVTKSGASTMTLTGTNTYTGATTISGGTLLINGNSSGATGAVAVNGTSTLGGTGTIGGTVTVAAGANLAPGASVGTLTIGGGLNVSAMAGGAGLFNYELGANTATSDQIAVTGTLTIGIGTLGYTNFAFSNAGGLQNGTYVLMTATGGINLGDSLDGADLSGSIGVGGTGTLQINGNSIELVVSGLGGGPGPLDHFAITPNPIGTTQTVGTPISGITITAQDVSNATVTSFTGTVTFGGTGGFTGTSASFTAGVLSGPLNVTPTISGSNLTFTVDDGATHTGSTTITTIQTQYDAWSGGAAFDADANGDGVKNGMAFLLGAANPSASALSLLPVVTQSGGNLTLTFNCLKAANRGSASLNVEHSSNLGISDPWTAVAVPESSGGPTSGVTFTVTAGGGSTNGVVATISSSEAASGKLFGRLKSNP